MALPTLQPYYVTKACVPRPEQVIVRRRNHQDDFKNKWLQTSEYFRQTSVGASKENDWTSSKAVQERYLKFSIPTCICSFYILYI